MVGLLAAAIAAVYPPFIHFSYYGGPGFLLSEGMFMVLLAAGVWCLARLAVRIRHWPTAAAAGVALGLATLTRPVTLLFPGVLAVWAWCAPRGERRDWAKAMAVVCAAMALTILPWTIRNARVHGRLVLVTSGAGQAFWVGNNLLARGGYVPRPQLFDPQTFDPGFTMTEAERFQKMAQQGFAFWREHPEKLPKLFLRKFLMLWNVYDVRYNLAYGLLLPWAALGLYAARRPAAPQIGRLLVGLLLYVSLISVIVIGSTRYRYPFEPYVILFAAAGLVWWFRRPAPRWVPATALAGIVGVNLAWYRCSDQVLAWLRGAFQAAGLR
ncbi:MAG: hypothetical protein HYY91_00915 [Candidatus Omnitrophica bacterium]|nr:hypothetical protein [Candidatus Omnitrophota bacterium]